MSTLMRRRPHTSSPPPWLKATYANTTKPSPPPSPRAYKPPPPSPTLKEPPIETTRPPIQSLITRLFSTRNVQPLPDAEPKDLARGVEASQRVLRGGMLDPRYRPAARRVTAIICALPLAMVLSYVLFERRFMGKEQKIRPGGLGGEEGEVS
ncbi:hypothetical protein B0A54_05505 [Friedmanniomyces endolithicus]|uniref:Uncharacterized protein n=1 Tax=Friedmanniomyces endolithicus TaxID=329885 RepID=A0A4U0V756_9PEZI|nr:hypothetical protein B0A54_05505 [Friedmanniomyces endolithicus]